MRVSRRLEVALAATVVVVATALAAVALVPSDERRTEVVRSDEGVPTTTSTDIVTTTTLAATTTTVAVTPAVARVNRRPVPRATTTTSTSMPEPGWGHGLWVTNVDGSDQRRIGDWTGESTWSPDGASLAVSTGQTIKVISARDGHQQRVLAGGTETWISCLDWSSSGDLAWLTREGKVYVASHQATAGRLIADNGDGQGTESCAWSPDGRLLAVTGDAVRVYTAQGVLLQQWKRDSDANTVYGAVSWSADGSRIAALEYSARVTRWQLAVFDPRTSAFGPAIAPDDRSIHNFAWHPDSSRLYVQTGEASHAAHFLVRVDDRSNTRIDGVCCRRLRPLRDGRFLAYAPAYGRENKQIVVVGPDFQVERVVARAEAPPAEPSMYACHGAYFLNAVVSPEGTQVAVDVSASYGPRCDSPVY